MKSKSQPNFSISINDQIICFEICGNEFASNLIVIAVNKKLLIGIVQLPQEESSEDNGLIWNPLKAIHHDCRATAINFSPECSMVVVPKIVTFCVAGSDFLLRIIRTDLQLYNSFQTLKGHSSYINEVAWDTSGNLLASVSNDHSCKIWSSDMNYECIITFCLSSAGMSVKWHSEEPQKVLVAEKRGIVHIYNVRSQQAVLSVESAKSPLMSADWSMTNRFCVTALAAGDVITWDLRRVCASSDVKQMHEDGGRVVKFSPITESVIASVGRPEATIKVSIAQSAAPQLEQRIKLFGGIAWHSRLPYIAVAQNRNLNFWKVKLK